MAEDTNSKIVSCDGNSNNANGHPLIYINLGKEGKVECPYCGQVFVGQK